MFFFFVTCWPIVHPVKTVLSVGAGHFRCVVFCKLKISNVLALRSSNVSLGCSFK
jgi:hypothetical protein